MLAPIYRRQFKTNATLEEIVKKIQPIDPKVFKKLKIKGNTINFIKVKLLSSESIEMHFVDFGKYRGGQITVQGFSDIYVKMTNYFDKIEIKDKK